MIVGYVVTMKSVDIYQETFQRVYPTREAALFEAKLLASLLEQPMAVFAVTIDEVVEPEEAL